MGGKMSTQNPAKNNKVHIGNADEEMTAREALRNLRPSSNDRTMVGNPVRSAPTSISTQTSAQSVANSQQSQNTSRK